MLTLLRKWNCSENNAAIIVCTKVFNYSAKDVPAEIAKVITQNEWRSLLNQLNNPMIKNSVGPFKWFLWVFLSHFHLLNAITLSEEQYAENGYSFSSPLIKLRLWSADYGLYNVVLFAQAEFSYGVPGKNYSKQFAD